MASSAWPCSPEKYRLLDRISRRVYRAEICLTEEPVAIKCYDLEELFENPNGLSSVYHGLAIIRGCQHRNILRYKTSFTTTGYEGRPPELWIVMPYMACGSLAQLLKSAPDKCLDEASTAYIMKEISHALVYLHAINIWHRSLTADHILVGQDMSIAITGLRYSVSTTKGGSVKRVLHEFLPDIEYLPYAAPEYLRQSINGYRKEIDVYSLGVVTVECLLGQHPFRGLTPTQMLLVKLQGYHPGMAEGKTWTKTACRFVTHCCRSIDRLNGHMLLSHPFLKSAKKSAPSALIKIGKACDQSPQPIIGLDDEIQEPEHVREPFSRRAFPQFNQGGLTFMRSGREVDGEGRTLSTHTEPVSPISPWSPTPDEKGVFETGFERDVQSRESSRSHLDIPDATYVTSGDGRSISIVVSPTGSVCSVVSNEELQRHQSLSSIGSQGGDVNDLEHGSDSDDDLPSERAKTLARLQPLPAGLQRISSSGQRDPLDKSDFAIVGEPLTATRCPGSCDHRDCNRSANSPVSPLSISDPNVPWNLTPVVTSPRREHVVSPLALHMEKLRVQSDPGGGGSPLASKPPVFRQFSEGTNVHQRSENHTNNGEHKDKGNGDTQA